MDAKTSQGRFIVLDGIRGAAAVVVMVFHFTQRLGCQFLFPYGWAAVDLFFILSGFVVALAYESKLQSGLPLVSFVKSRSLRLYPLYMVGLAIGIVAYVTLGGSRIQGGVDLSTAFVLGSLLIPYVGNHKILFAGEWRTNELFPLNGPSWSLFLEMAVNLLFGYLVAVKRLSMKYVLYFGLALILFVKIASKFSTAFGNLNGGWEYSNAWIGVIRVLYGFPAGVVIYHCYAQNRLPRISLNAFWVILATLLAMSVPAHFGHSSLVYKISTNYSFILTLVVWPVVVWLGATATAGRAAAISLSWLGRISYAVYVIHFPLFRTVSSYADPRSLTVVCISIVITFMLAHILTYHVEPLLRKRMATLLA